LPLRAAGSPPISMPRVHEQLRDRLAEVGVGSPSASSSRQIRKASRAEYVMRPLEFLVAYRGRHSSARTAMVSDHWPKLYGAGDPIDGCHSGVRPGVDEATIAVQESRPRLRRGRTRRGGRREHAAVQAGDEVFGTCGGSFAECASGSSGRARAKADEPQPVSYLSARWTLSSTASGQDVPGQQSDDDDRRRDCDDGDGGGGYDHAAILAGSGAEVRR
jgi:hypothetical protein